MSSNVQSYSQSGFLYGRLIASPQESTGKSGWFPLSCTAGVNTALLQEVGETGHETDPPGTTEIDALKCMALFPYSAREADELSFAAGDLITVTKESADEWVFGIAGDQFVREGWLPANYVKPIHPGAAGAPGSSSLASKQASAESLKPTSTVGGGSNVPACIPAKIPAGHAAMLELCADLQQSSAKASPPPTLTTALPSAASAEGGGAASAPASAAAMRGPSPSSGSSGQSQSASSLAAPTPAAPSTVGLGAANTGVDDGARSSTKLTNKRTSRGVLSPAARKHYDPNHPKPKPFPAARVQTTAGAQVPRQHLPHSGSSIELQAVTAEMQDRLGARRSSPTSADDASRSPTPTPKPLSRGSSPMFGQSASDLPSPRLPRKRSKMFAGDGSPASSSTNITAAASSSINKPPPPIPKRTSSKELVARSPGGVAVAVAVADAVATRGGKGEGSVDNAGAGAGLAASVAAASSADVGGNSAVSSYGGGSQRSQAAPARRPSRRTSKKFAPRPSRVVKAHTPSGADELSLAVGETVTIIDQLPTTGNPPVAWMVGVKPQGQGKGKFPANCVAPMKRATKI